MKKQVIMLCVTVIYYKVTGIWHNFLYCNIALICVKMSLILAYYHSVFRHAQLLRRDWRHLIVKYVEKFMSKAFHDCKCHIPYIPAYKSTRVYVELVKYLVKKYQNWKIFLCYKTAINYLNWPLKQKYVKMGGQNIDPFISRIDKKLSKYCLKFIDLYASIYDTFVLQRIRTKKLSSLFSDHYSLLSVSVHFCMCMYDVTTSHLFLKFMKFCFCLFKSYFDSKFSSEK